MSKRAAIYPRVSTRAQEDKYGLSEQRDMCTRYCHVHGYTIVEDFTEVHTGYELDERPQMTRLRDMMCNREVDVVVAVYLDRLARDQNHQAVLYYQAQKYGVDIELVEEEIDDTPTGKVLRSVMGMVAEIERDRIKARFMNGKRQKVKQGKMVGAGAAPYGYRWANSEKSSLELNPETAPIVRQIFQAIIEGKTMRGVLKDLTDRQIPTTRDTWLMENGQVSGGRSWALSSLRYILGNEIYCGRSYQFVWKHGKERRIDHKSGAIRTVLTKVRRANDAPETSVLEGVAPVLVTDEQFKIVQQRLAQNKQLASRHTKHPEAALLRGGFVSCGVCGRHMYVMQAGSRNKGNVFVYYCRHRVGDLVTSGGMHIGVNMLDLIVWKHVTHLLTNPDIVAAEVERNATNGPSAHKKDALDALETRIANLKRQQGNLASTIAAVDDPDVRASLVEKASQLASARRSADDEVRFLKRQHFAESEVAERISGFLAWCSVMGERLESLTFEQRRLALKALGICVTVWPLGHDPRWRIQVGSPAGIALPDSLLETSSAHEPGEPASEADSATTDCVHPLSSGFITI